MNTAQRKAKYGHLKPPGVDAAGDYRWALGILEKEGDVSVLAVSELSGRSRRLIAQDGGFHQDVRDEIVAAMARQRGGVAAGADADAASADAAPGEAATAATATPDRREGRIDHLRRSLRVADSLNAELLARTLDAEKGRRRAERRLDNFRRGRPAEDEAEAA